MSVPAAWPRAWPQIGLGGAVKERPEDFLVEEVLGFEPDGEGEHVLVQVEKCGLDTAEVAGLIARGAGVRRGDVSWAGRKDRQARARQWLSVRLAGRRAPDFGALDGPKLRVLRVERHRRKLRPGTLAGNRFRIRIRAATGAREATAERLGVLALRGAPNYFGAQRFGRDGANLAAARTALAGDTSACPRSRRSLLFSAARAWLFNLVLAARVRTGSWERILPGELVLLEGSRSFFRALDGDAALAARLAAFDVSPSGPLCGVQRDAPAAEAQQVEQTVLAAEHALVAGLVHAGLRGARRSLRLRPQDLDWEWDGADLVLAFALGPGSYATALLAELLDPAPAAGGPV